MSLTARLTKTGLKGAGLALLAVVSTPFVWAGYTLGKWYYAGTKFAFKHPNVTAAGLLVAGSLTYYTLEHRGALTQTVGSFTHSTIAQVYELRTSELERKLAETNAEHARERDELEQRMREVLNDRDRLTQEKRTYAPLRASPAQQTGAPGMLATPTPKSASTLPVLGTREREGHVFYYVKQGETLIGIAQQLTGDSSTHTVIAKLNGVQRGEDLLTGQLLEIPAQMCRGGRTDVYTRVPDLQHIVLSGNRTIRDAFPDRWREVLAINNALGLDYADRFSIKSGSRVIYYER